MKRLQCECCDREDIVLSERGWCTQCEQDFEAVQKRERWTCNRPDGLCDTPYTCAMRKTCMRSVANDGQPPKQELLPCIDPL